MDVDNIADRLLDEGDVAGTYREAGTGAVLTLPWPNDPRHLPPSLAPYAVSWAATYLVHHLSGEEWRYTPGQLRWLHLWYAIDAEGRWLYRRGVKRGSKGTGKDPLAASHSGVELLAPCRFAGWARPPAPGVMGVPLAEPVGMPLVQIAANSEGQAADVLRVLAAMIPAATREEYGVDVGTTRIAAAGGGLVQLLTTSTASAEGDPASHITVNESHHLTKSNGGHSLAGVCRRNVGKSPGGLARVVEYTNAHQPGADSVAERSYHAWQSQVSGKAPSRDILYDSREAEPGIVLGDEAAVVRGLRQAYADAPWVDLRRIRDELYDPDTPASDARRFYLNNNTAAEDSLFDPGDYDACVRMARLGGFQRLTAGDAIVLFGDGSKSDDATGIVACRMSDGAIAVVHHQQPGHDLEGRPLLADRDWTDGDVRDTFDRYAVLAFAFDPSAAKDHNADGEDDRYWWPLVDEWATRHGQTVKAWATPAGRKRHAVAYDLRDPERQAEWCGDVRQLVDDVVERRLLPTASAVLRTHMHNARKRPGKYGLGLGKASRESPHKVDLAVCVAGARGLRRRLLLAQAAAKPERSAAPVRGIR